MNQKSIAKRPLLRSQRILLPLIVVAVLLFVVALSSAGKPAYAANPNTGVSPQSSSGGGGGGSELPNTIYGYVYTYASPASQEVPIVGVSVYLVWDYCFPVQGPILYNTTTGPGGYFIFNESDMYEGAPLPIYAHTTYFVDVNGWYNYQSNPITSLGVTCDYPAWGQWSGNVTTDSNGCGVTSVQLNAAAVTNVTFAALYSNTKFATLSYGTGSSSTFYHTLSFGVLNSGISAGYSASQSGSFTASVTGVESIAIQRMYYSNAYYDSSLSSPGVVAAGITALVPYQGYYDNAISEYITNPSGLLTTDRPHTFSFGLAPSTETYYYSESGSYTWGASVGSPFGILFSAWGNVITLDETVTTTTGHTNDVTISVTIPQGYGTVDFMAYCPGPAGTSFNPLEGNVGTGSYELHIWDMSSDG